MRYVLKKIKHGELGILSGFNRNATWLLALALGVATSQFAWGQGFQPPQPRGPEKVIPADYGPLYSPKSTPPVADVRFEGYRSVSDVKIRSYVRTRAGRPFDPELAQADVRRLATSGLFQDVRTFTEQTPAGLVVTFQVFERPTINFVHFVGNKAIRDKILLRESGLKQGESINLYSVERARQQVEDFYRSKGFDKARVSIHQGNQPKDRGVVLFVNEGVKQKIWAVEFVGNTIASDGRLKTQIQSKPALLRFVFGGDVDEEKIDADVERITAYYRSLGFFRARVGRELNYTPSGEWLNIRFVIDEGPRYRVNRISIAGNEKFTEAELKEHLRLIPGDFFSLGTLDTDVRALRDLYGGQGHIFADIQADPRFLEEPGLLDIVFNVSEGEQYRVGEIFVNIDGPLAHTRRSVILNRLSFRPGDIIDSREIRNSERRLRSSQLFANNPAQGTVPSISVRPPETDEMNAVAGRPKYRGQSPDADESDHRQTHGHMHETSYRAPHAGHGLPYTSRQHETPVWQPTPYFAEATLHDRPVLEPWQLTLPEEPVW